MKPFTNLLCQMAFLGAVISLTSASGLLPANADEVFIDGLAGQLKDRGTYYGYWSQSVSKIRCNMYWEGRDGKRSYYWGNLNIQFLDPNFPSRWTAEIGYCNQPPKLPWRAYPIVGEGFREPLSLP